MSSDKAFIILGNQLFPKEHLRKFSDYHFFMAEDQELCSYVKHHKQKIVMFLSAMRSYADDLISNKYKLTYYDLEHALFKQSYEKKLLEFVKQYKIKKIHTFEIEDKFFEQRMVTFCKINNLDYQVTTSPMFVTSRDEFSSYLSNNKKPFMATFYKQQRIRLKVLLVDKNKPVGGKWSFDQDNRKKLATSITVPKVRSFKETKHTTTLKVLVEKHFATHP